MLLRIEAAREFRGGFFVGLLISFVYFVGGAMRGLESYFAYGSNMVVSQMAARCLDARIIGTALLRNHRFLINSRGYATIVPMPGMVVYGIVWSVTSTDLCVLDLFEGVAADLYRRVLLLIEMAQGPPHWALVYVAADVTPGLPRRNYLEQIIEAARKHEFPNDYVDELLRLCDRQADPHRNGAARTQAG